MDELSESGTDGINGNKTNAPNHKRQNGPMSRTDDPASGERPLSQSITILHFNDVYNINAREEEPVGGAACFATAMRQLKHLDPLVLFSGDIFNPSVMSAVTKGEQMVPILKALDVKCAVFGNHDFDFGMDHVADLVKRTQFPWLMSNVYDNVTENTLADGSITHMISWNGRKIGLVGLVEEAWIETLATVDPEEITFVDFVEEGRFLAKQLKEQGADVVIALTHMRWPNDVRLAECAPEIDLILGGHDHDYLVKQINGKFVIKSGSDFRNFSEVTLSFLDDGHIDVKVREIVVDSSFSEDAEVKTIVDKYTDVMSAKMELVLGVMEVDLEGRFAKVRTEETNLGNFVTDIMLKSVDADLALLNSGTLRSDVVHKAGPFKMKDLLAILPMVDPLVVIQVTGRQIVSALENSVSQYPSHEGRFAQVAGVRFAFDAQKPPGYRIKPENVEVQGIPLDLEKNYRLCTKQYLAEGKDGYIAFKGCPMLVNDEDGPRLSTCIINYFKSVQMLRDEEKSLHCHRHSILTVTRRKTLTRQMSVDFWIGAETCSEASSSQSWYHANVTMLRRKSMVRQTSVELTACHTLLQPDNISGNVSRSKALLQRRTSIEVCEKESVATALAPQVDGRVCFISDQGTEGRRT